MDEYVAKFTSLLRYVPYLREEKAKVQRFLSSLPAPMRERIEFFNPQTMDEAVRKACMCYQQYKTKGDGGKGWQPKKNQKNSSTFKSSKRSHFKGAGRNTSSKQFNKNHQRIKWPAEEKPTEASSKPE